MQDDPSGHVTKTTYNCLGQPLQVTHPDHVAGTRERIETFTYDTRGKLIQKSGAGGYPLTYRYDAVGNLTELEDGNGKITRWTYTALNQVATKTYADATAHAYTYDAAGRLLTRKDALDRTTNYTKRR
jgi:YD repeat-containing protein